MRARTAPKNFMTKSQFNRFKKEFTAWQNRLGLAEYTVAFRLAKLENEWATCEASPEGCICTITVSSAHKWSTQEVTTAAIHECTHLLLARLTELATRRFVDADEIWNENERVVCVLEKVLCPPKKKKN